MSLNIDIEAKDAAKVALKHPVTNEAIGTFIIAGPDHEATKRARREAIDRMQMPGGEAEPEEAYRMELMTRTIGWEGIQDAATGEEAPFDRSALPRLYRYHWLYRQVMEAVNDRGFFYRD